MKVYVHANTNHEPVEVIEVIMNLSIPASSIAASHDDDNTRYIVDPLTGKTYPGMFKRLINDIEVEAAKLGLARTHIEKSKTNSTYMDFCVGGQVLSRTVRVMCFFRITDHHDWDVATRVRHIEKRLTYYQTGVNAPGDTKKYEPNAAKLGLNNGRDGKIDIYLENIMVGEEDCNTIKDAVDAVKEKLINFIIFEKRPFDKVTIKNYINQLKEKMSKLPLHNIWDVTYNEAGNDFLIINFNETTLNGNRSPNVQLIIKYRVDIGMLNRNLGSVTIDLKMIGRGQTCILDIECTKAHKRKGIFEDSKVKKLFKSHIADALIKAERRTI